MKQGFSIIIPTCNTLPYLKLCLKSFKDHSAYSHQIIVCADGCRDGTNEFLRTYPGIDAVILDKNQGICSATNQAARLANREYLFLANDDLVAAPGWDQALMSLATSDRILSGVQIEPEWVPVAPCHLKQDFGRVFDEFREPEFLKYAAEESRQKQGVAEAGVNYPFLVHRELWNRLEGLDERFNPGPGSDPDLFYRLALGGAEFLRIRSCLFYHFGGRASRFAGESGRQSNSWKQAAARSRDVFSQKWGRPWDFGFGQAPKIKRPESLAFFVWGGIGNMIMALPAIDAARKDLPEAKITVIAQKQIMLQLVPPEIQSTVALNDPSYRGATGLLKLIKDLRKIKPRITLTSLPFPPIRYGLLALISGARDRVCPKANKIPGCNLKIQTGGKHYLERNLELLRPAGIDRKFRGYNLALVQDEIKQADEFLRRQKIDSSKRVGLHPGAGHPRKRWAKESFVALGKILTGRGFYLLVFGGPEEKQLADYLASSIGSSAYSWVGNHEFRATLALIRSCRAFISNDSGLAHCAAALAVPTLTIFGPTDPALSRPYGQMARVVQSPVKCGPCYRPANRYGCRQCDPRCLSQIFPEQVLKEFETLWRQSKPKEKTI
ncbi:glycosyltransferase [candidate division TA06 bacterium]|uniref:Glycosyltransferase n=1 Tax=candidate division TA06 bacterium TaxID=2250710 RepID=A0A933MJZ8_UNCT6|nr:glycosyltransferase [candidate division TA06 bacterium]